MAGAEDHRMFFEVRIGTALKFFYIPQIEYGNLFAAEEHLRISI